jgi:hypothetical protein
MSLLTDQLRARLARSFDNFNPQGAHNALDEIFASLSIDAALSEVVLPYVQTLQLGTASEVARVQFASSLLAGRLLAVGDGWESGGAPTVVVAYPADDRHTLGGLAFCLALRDRGWRIVYLGTNVTAESAAEAARATGARAVVLAAREVMTFARFPGPLPPLGEQRRFMVAGDGATAAAARRLNADLLPGDPVPAARDLHRRLGPGSRAQSLVTLPGAGPLPPGPVSARRPPLHRRPSPS